MEYEFNNHDMKYTKQLITDLGIQDIVTWLPTMSQHELSSWYAKVDIVADQFSNGAFGLIGTEALAVGAPLLVYLEKKNEEYFGENPPVLNAKTSDDIVKIIEEVHSRDIDLDEVSERSKAWFKKYMDYELLSSKYKTIYENVLNIEIS